MKIAIDGPAGAGKSTVARTLAQILGFIYVDTGAMYRALTWKALGNGIDLKNSEALYELAKNIKIHFQSNSDKQRIICDNKDITDYIRLPEVSAQVSLIASYTTVREIMVQSQREMAETMNVVMDGRDIGECVLPEADYKFYLTADINERVKRRIKDLEIQGYIIDIKSAKEDILKRDLADSTRDVGALKILEDSIIIDTSNLSIKQVLDKILSIIQEG
jgi:cytidylate kinase